MFSLFYTCFNWVREILVNIHIYNLMYILFVMFQISNTCINIKPFGVLFLSIPNMGELD